jgi:nucleoside 2-deoxyribosyltransferase
MITKKHKVFCSYALTGEDRATVAERLQLVAQMLKDAGIQAYCNLHDTTIKRPADPKRCIDAALKALKSCDVVFVIQASERRSEGMLIEIGAAYAAGKPIILARHQSAKGKTYLDQLAQKTVDWRTNQDLQRVLQELIVI